ncbi:MAG: hypothetical protein OEW00_14080 [candidate division Zixibacteria bacterium]|nr:hypothetical protein [candidate division Zixibacteria bacterium]
MSGWSFEYSFDLDEKHSVIYEKIYGIWRETTARNYHEDFVKEVTPIIDRPWAKLIDLSNWKTSSPEVIEIVGEHLAWCVEHNMVASINIINNPVTYGQLMRMFAKGKTKNISQVYRTRDEGLKALKELGFNPDYQRNGFTK